MKIKKISFILLLFITSFLIGITFIPKVNADYSANKIDYKFEENIFDTSNKTNINLRHNNVITGDYNGTYSFINDINGNVPIGWNNLSVGNGRVVALKSTIDKHYANIRLKTIDTDNAQIEQEFDDGSQIEGIIELWYRTSDSTRTSYIRCFSDSTEIITIRNTGDIFQVYESGNPITLDIIPLDNIWYHFSIYFDCILDISNITINGYYEGSFDFNNVADSIDTLDFLNSGFAGGWTLYFDAIGYSWASNYTIHENIYPNIEIVDSNILSSDMYQFNFDRYGNLYTHMEYDLLGWTTIEPTYTFIDFPTFHYYRRYPSESIKSKNVVRIVSHTSGAGIKNESLNLYLDKINISFGLEFNSIDSIIQHSFNITVKSRDNIKIVEIAFIPISITEVEMLYFDGTSWILLETFDNITPFDTYDFNLYLNDFSISLLWYKNGVFNNSHSFPYIIDRNGVNSLSFIVYDSTEDSYYLVMKIQDVGIYQYNISQTLESGCIRYNFKNTWNFNTHNLFNFTSNDFSKIITYIYDTAFDYWWIQYYFEQSIFYNFDDVEIKPYTNLWIITNNISVNNIELSISGVKVMEYDNNVFIKEYFPSYTYYNSNPNSSYFYVDNYNRLNYKLTITQNDTMELIKIKFMINERLTTNRSVFLRGKETSATVGLNMFRFIFTNTPYYFTDITVKPLLRDYSFILTNGYITNRFDYVISDNANNNFTGYIYEGFIYNLRLDYHPMGFIPLPYDFTILGLIDIMIPLIILIVPTIGIYSVYRKKEIIIPVLLLMTIICFSSALIPFELFFIMLVCFGCGIFLQQKYKREYD